MYVGVTIPLRVFLSLNWTLYPLQFQRVIFVVFSDQDLAVYQ